MEVLPRRTTKLEVEGETPIFNGGVKSMTRSMVNVIW